MNKKYLSIISIFLVVFVAFGSGCATIVKGGRQDVFFRGGPEASITKIQSPDGTFDIENGSGSYLMTRSKSDIPIKVKCANGVQKASVIETRFDWWWGGFANLIWLPTLIGPIIAWIVDGTSDKSYNISDARLSNYCTSAIDAETKKH